MGEVVVNVPLHTVAVESTMVRPVGRASKNATPVSVVDGLGFAIVKTRLVVALRTIVEGVNCLAILGGDCAKAERCCNEKQDRDPCGRAAPLSPARDDRKCERPRRRAAEEQPDEVAPSNMIELHPIPPAGTALAGYRIWED